MQTDDKSQAVLPLLAEKETSRKFAFLRGRRVLPEKLLTQPYPQTRWDFSIILYSDSMQTLCIDYKETTCFLRHHIDWQSISEITFFLSVNCLVVSSALIHSPQNLCDPSWSPNTQLSGLMYSPDIDLLPFL